jgi:hypothetical protein
MLAVSSLDGLTIERDATPDRQPDCRDDDDGELDQSHGDPCFEKLTADQE